VTNVDPQPLIEFVRDHLTWVDPAAIGNNLIADAIYATPPLLIWRGPAVVRRGIGAVREAQHRVRLGGATAGQWLTSHLPPAPPRIQPSFSDTAIRFNVAEASLGSSAQLSATASVSSSASLNSGGSLSLLLGSQPAMWSTDEQVARMRGWRPSSPNPLQQLRIWPNSTVSLGPAST
jgi:hypothetical protein